MPQGRGSAPEEQSLAVSLACMLAGAGAEGEVQVLSEGEEGGEFWTLLGGKTDYASASSRWGVCMAHFDAGLVFPVGLVLIQGAQACARSESTLYVDRY